jgi:hypothetical protein
VTRSIRLEASRADAQVVRDRRAPRDPGRGNGACPFQRYTLRNSERVARVRGRHGCAILHRGRDHGGPLTSGHRTDRRRRQRRASLHRVRRVDDAIEAALLQVVGPGAIAVVIAAEAEAAARPIRKYGWLPRRRRRHQRRRR